HRTLITIKTAVLLRGRIAFRQIRNSTGFSAFFLTPDNPVYKNNIPWIITNRRAILSGSYYQPSTSPIIYATGYADVARPHWCWQWLPRRWCYRRRPHANTPLPTNGAMGLLPASKLRMTPLLLSTAGP